MFMTGGEKKDVVTFVQNAIFRLKKKKYLAYTKIYTARML